jgi:hypothetical protein
VPATVPVSVKVWAMVVPLPAAAPVIPVCATVHEKVVPVKLLVSTIEVAPPEVITCDAGVAVAIGIGSSSSSHDEIKRTTAKRLKIKLTFFIANNLLMIYNYF